MHWRLWRGHDPRRSVSQPFQGFSGFTQGSAKLMKDLGSAFGRRGRGRRFPSHGRKCAANPDSRPDAYRQVLRGLVVLYRLPPVGWGIKGKAYDCGGRVCRYAEGCPLMPVMNM